MSEVPVLCFFAPWKWSLPAQPISSRKKPINLCAPREFLKSVCHVWWSYNLVILIQTFRMFSLRESAFRALFTWRTARAKDHRLFYRSYPQINEVGKSCHVVCLPVESLLVFLFPSEFYGQFHQLCFHNNVNKEPRGEGRWPVRPQHVFMFLCVLLTVNHASSRLELLGALRIMGEKALPSAQSATEMKCVVHNGSVWCSLFCRESGVIEDDGTAGDFGFTADGKVKKNTTKTNTLIGWLVCFSQTFVVEGGGVGNRWILYGVGVGGRKFISRKASGA